jgi:hypothetical protein
VILPPSLARVIDERITATALPAASPPSSHRPTCQLVIGEACGAISFLVASPVGLRRLPLSAEY